MEILTEDKIAMIKAPLPSEAVSQHPTKSYLSSIKAIYVTERMNEVFGIGGWSIKTRKEEDGGGGMIVVHVTLEVPRYGIYYECFGGNDNGGENNKNFDLGDAYKGATTDAITKICSYIGIGADVFKGKQKAGSTPQTGKKELPSTDNESCNKCGGEMKWSEKKSKYYCEPCVRKWAEEQEKKKEIDMQNPPF